MQRRGKGGCFEAIRRFAKGIGAYAYGFVSVLLHKLQMHKSSAETR